MTIVGVGNRISALGDSITAATGAWPNWETDGYMYHVTMAPAVAGRFIRHPVIAYGGETLSQILGRVPEFDSHTGLYGSLPAYCCVLAGANDNAFTNHAGKLATISSIYDGLLTRGILPIGLTVPPTETNANKKNVTAFNIGVALLCQKRGLPFVNPFGQVVDSATGNWNATYRSDGIHPNEAGAQVMGEYIAERLLDGAIAQTWEPPLVQAGDSDSDDTLLKANPLFLIDTNSDGTPDGWTVSQGAAELTVSVADGTADGIWGNWLTLQKTGTAGPSSVIDTGNLTVAAGDWIGIGFVYDWTQGTGTPNVAINLQYTLGTLQQLVRVKIGRAADLGPSRFWDIVKVPVGVTQIKFTADIGGATGTLRIGQFTIANLTSLGIAPYAVTT
jgi:lysophospholipase L1-like esterase